MKNRGRARLLAAGVMLTLAVSGAYAADEKPVNGRAPGAGVKWMMTGQDADNERTVALPVKPAKGAGPAQPVKAAGPIKPVELPTPVETVPVEVKDDAKEGLVKAGKIYYDWKDYKSAIKKWKEALTLDPGNKTISASIADAQQKLEAERLPKAAPANIARAPSQGPPAPAAKIPKDITRRPLFNLSLQNTDKPRINIGRQWFSWFKKETNVPELPAGQTLSLDDCIGIAIRNHIPLQVANDSIKLAQMRVNETKRNLLPTATLIYEQYTGEVNARQYIGRKQYIEGQQPVFAGGQLWFAMKQAQVNLEISKCDYSKIKNELTLQVKKGYYTLGKARENLRIQDELYNEVIKIAEMVRKEAEFNVTSKLEYLNTSSQATQVKYQLEAAAGDVGVAELILKQTMNLDPLEKLLVRPKMDFRKADVSYEEAARSAFTYNPAIKMNTLMLQYYDYGRRIAAGKFLPKIDILGSWGLAKEEYSPEDMLGPTSPSGAAASGGPIYDVDTKLEQQWYAGVKGSMNFWGSTGEYSYVREQWVPVVSAYQGTEAATNTFKLHVLDKIDAYSDKQQAQVDYDRSRQELTKVKQDTTLEIKEGCFNYEKALLQLDTSTNKVKYQTMDLEYTQIKRGYDEAPDSAVVDSMMKLAQEKFGYAQALADCHIAVASINKAIGVEDYYKDE